jgi:hypothetical protein
MPVVPVNVDVAWHVMQSPLGGCFGSCVAVGRVTIVTPKKLLPVSWQVTQPLVIPAWFIAVPGPNLLVEVWHAAQSPLAGMCPVPCALGVTPRNAMPEAAEAWHVVQPLAMPVWFITPGLYPEALVWQSVQAWDVGM